MPSELTLDIRQISPTASEARTASHKLLIDRPAAKGGSGKGPMGGELFLAAIGGCLMSNMLAAIRARQSPISDVTMRVTANVEEAPPRFTAVEIVVSATCPDRETMQHVVEVADRGC